MKYVPVLDDRVRRHASRCAEAYSLFVDFLRVVELRAHDDLDDAMERVRSHRHRCDLCIVAEVMES